MNHLILIAHGSRRAQSNQAMLALADKIKTEYAQLSVCFLEMAEPNLATAIDSAIACGARSIDVFPYFLGPGNHVHQDIPALLEQARDEHPQISFRQLSFFGAHPRIGELLSTVISQAQPMLK